MKASLAILCVLVNSATPLLAQCACNEEGSCCSALPEATVACCTATQPTPASSCCTSSPADPGINKCSCCSGCFRPQGEQPAIPSVSNAEKSRSDLIPAAAIVFEAPDASPTTFRPQAFESPPSIHASHQLRQAWLAVWLN